MDTNELQIVQMWKIISQSKNILYNWYDWLVHVDENMISQNIERVTHIRVKDYVWLINFDKKFILEKKMVILKENMILLKKKMILLKKKILILQKYLYIKKDDYSEEDVNIEGEDGILCLWDIAFKMISKSNFKI